MLTIVFAFGLHAAVDWTWYIPATAVPAVLCAGWLAGRGPLGARVGLRPQPRGLLSHPGIPAAVASVTVLALALAWAIWQPLRAIDADNAAAAAPTAAAAFADARAAVAEDPVSVNALAVLGSLYLAAGNAPAARREFVLETRRQPHNFAAWRDLGTFDLQHNRVTLATKELLMAHLLNLGNPATIALLQAAQAAQARAAGAAR
jgi:hypothetical protein